MTRSRASAVAFAALLLLSLCAPVVGGVAAQENTTSTATPEPTTTATPTPTSTSTPTPTPEAENGTTGETGSTGPPGVADSVRILPVRRNVDFLYINERERGAVYNTSGPFAEFEVSEAVQRAQILEQSGADAQVRAQGHLVKIEYEPDAAPVGSSSLYRLRLYFDDGSERTIHLYASQTSVDVAERGMREYRPFILEYQDAAEAAGYGRSPEALMELKAERDRKLKYVEQLFIDQAISFAAGVGRLMFNPISYIVGAIALALLVLFQIRRFGWVFDMLTKGAGEAQRLHKELWTQMQQDQQTAKEEPISDIRHISRTDETIFEDTFGIDTTLDVAELAREGVKVKRDGEVQVIGGVDQINAEDVHDSWLNELVRDTRYNNPQTPLAVMKKCLSRMCNTHAQTTHYKEPLEKTQDLIDELDSSRDHEHYRTHEGMARRRTTEGRNGTADAGAAGGDD